VAFGARTVGGLCATILVARVAGPQGFGRFQFALALTLLLSFLVTLGLPKLLVRELARHPDETKDRVDSALFVALTAGLAVTGLLFATSRLLDVGTSLVVMAGLALTADSATRIVMAPFWAFERMRYEAITIGVQETAFVILTVVALVRGRAVEGVMLAYLVSRVIGFSVAWLIASSGLGCRTRPRWHWQVLRPMIRTTTPFAIDEALSLAYIRVDAVLLGIFKGPTAVGLYQAATNLVLYLNILPRTLNMSMFPQMSRAWPSRPHEVRQLRDASLRLLAAIAVPIMVGSFLLAPRIIEFVYGPGFDRAAVAYRLLAVIIPVRMLGNTLGTALTSIDRQTQRTVIVGMAAVVNIGLNLVLIPQWSILGAVVATLVTEFGVFFAYALLLRRVVGPSCLLAAFVTPILACVPLVVVVVAFSATGLVVLVALAGAVYAAALGGVVLATMPRPIRGARGIFGSFLAMEPMNGDRSDISG
jgi:O-antigen/teichoic acid export membrane protein